MSIEIKNVTKEYGLQKALNDVSFTVNQGEILGFLGPNGAGKSTLMKIITCFIPPTEGTVLVNGMDVREDSLAIRKIIGYLPEHNPLYLDMYVKEYLRFIAGVHKLSNKKAKVADVVDLVGLGREQNKRIGELSKGYKQRVGLAQALIHNPKVLSVDEPTSGLDPNQLADIRKVIKEIGKEKTVMFSSHIMQEVEAMCDRVIIINKGIIDSNKVNLAKTMLHETIHTLTSRFINEYIDKEGNLLPNAPKELVSFNLLMNNYKKQIKDKYSEEFDVFMTKYKAHKSGDGQIPVGFTRKEIELFYPTINMKEFIATVLGNNEHFLEEAGQMKYLKSDLTIVQKFGKIVVDLLNKLKELSGLEHNLAEEAIIQSLNIIETIKVKNETVNNNINEEVSEFDIARYEEMYRLMDEQQNNEPDGLPAIKRTPKNCI